MISVCKMINSRNLYIVSVVNNTVLHTVYSMTDLLLKYCHGFTIKWGVGTTKIFPLQLAGYNGNGMPVIPALRELRWESHFEFQTSLGYRVRPGKRKKENPLPYVYNRK